MARGQSQYLRIFGGATTYARWHNHYTQQSVALGGVVWNWISFDVDGFTEGQTGDEGGMTVTLPGTAFVIEQVEAALRDAHLVELLMYEFDTLAEGAASGPVAVQDLIASYVGEVVGASGTFESISLELGSSLSPVGAQVPPRTFTTRLVGAPCKL
jgi:hypothetical protein